MFLLPVQVYLLDSVHRGAIFALTNLWSVPYFQLYVILKKWDHQCTQNQWQRIDSYPVVTEVKRKPRRLMGRTVFG